MTKVDVRCIYIYSDCIPIKVNITMSDDYSPEEEEFDYAALAGYDGNSADSDEYDGTTYIIFY